MSNLRDEPVPGSVEEWTEAAIAQERRAEVAEARVAELEAGIRREHYARRVQVGSEYHGGPAQYADRCVCGEHPCNLRALVGDETPGTGEHA